jgi:ceramide glucosyltransferase
MAVLFLSFLAALAYPQRPKCVEEPLDLAPLTAIVPIKDLHADFDEALSSLFRQAHDGIEIVIASAEPDSAAVKAAQRTRAAFPAVSSRLIASARGTAVSPKLSNLWPAIASARHDLILTKDSNIQLESGELQNLVRHLAPGVGLVSSISIATNPKSFAAWIETSIINCYHARVLMLAGAAGCGFGLGKIMLFRKTDLFRAGGLDRMAWAVGEDQALSGALSALGLKTVLADRVSHQTLGFRRFSEAYERQLRWMVIWRVQLPAVFFADILGSAIPTAAAGALAAHFFGLATESVVAVTLATWLCLESLLCAAKGWPISIWSPLAFFVREMLTPFLWLRAWTTRDVMWAGTACRVADPVGNRHVFAPRRNQP